MYASTAFVANKLLNYLKTVSCEKVMPFLVFDSVFSETEVGDFIIDFSGKELSEGNGEMAVGFGIKSTVPHLRPRSPAVLEAAISSSLAVMFVVVLLSNSF